MPANRRFLRVTALALLLSPSILASGCYGKFPLLREVYRINGEITDNKWVHTILMWVGSPIYCLAELGDLLVTNMIEFWTGKPVHVDASVRQPDGTEITLKSEGDDNTLVMTVQRPNEEARVVRYVRQSGGWTTVHNGTGTLLGYIYAPGNGEVWMYNADHKLLLVIGRNDLPWSAAAIAN